MLCRANARIAKSWGFCYMAEENIRSSGPLHVSSDYQPTKQMVEQRIDSEV